MRPSRRYSTSRRRRNMTASCCPASSSAAELLRATSCLLTAADVKPCEHNVTSASHVMVFGAHCIGAPSGRGGFFVQSRTASGNIPCSGGDIYRAYVHEQSRHSHDIGQSLFSTFSSEVVSSNLEAGQRSTGPLYFIDTDAGTRLPGNHSYTIRLILQETQQRSRLVDENAQLLFWSATDGSSPTRDWLRYRACVDELVPLPEEARALSVVSPMPPEDEPQCGRLAPSTPTALVALGVNDSCAWRCSGDAHTRLVSRIPTWSNPRELPDRVKIGYRHVVKPTGCRLHLYERDNLTACLRGQSILNIGGSAANGLQRGFERISGKCQNWWFNYVRTIGDKDDRSPGVSVFGRSAVVTQYMHHPFRMGLLNVVDPQYVINSTGKHVGPRGDRAIRPHTPESYEKLMCDFDIVVFESGVHDISFPDSKGGLVWALSKQCAGPTPCSDTDILPLLANQSFRLDLLGSYRAHLQKLVAMWTHCREARQRKKRTFRPIFKLAYAPAHSPRVSDRVCASPWGHNVFASYMKGANDVARQVIEGGGFEVFDTFPATMHAMKHWFDQGGKDVQHSDALSDLVTQMLLNQICGPAAAE